MAAKDDADDDASLVRATLGGRTQAFGLLYDRYAPLVRALCFDSTRDLATAQDLSQESFLRAYRTLHKLRKPERFGPWLVGITKHVCREWRRGAGRGRKRLERVSMLATPQSVESTDDPGDDELRQLHDALAALPEQDRAALHVFYLQEQPADAAATLLGLSRSGFYKSLERAKARLRRVLGLARSRTGDRRRGVTP